MTASSFCVREPRWYYNTSPHAITVSKTTPICNTVTLFDLIDAERLKFLRRRRKPFRRRATFAWRAFVTSELVKLYGQQYYCSVCSWLQRNRDGGVDHLFGLGPVRAASLKSSPLGLVAALAQWAGQSAAHDALTLTQRRKTAPPLEPPSSPSSATIHALPSATITPQSDLSRIGSKLYLSRDCRHAEVLDL